MVKECVFARLGLDALSPALLCSPAVVSSFALKLCLPDNASVMANSNSNTTRYPKSGGLYIHPACSYTIGAPPILEFVVLKITGLNELSKKLDTLAGNVAKLNGTHQVPIAEMLTPEFMAGHTRFANIDEFFDASGFQVISAADFEAIPTEPLDEFVRTESSFESWEAMAAEAGKTWALKQLKL